MPMKRELYPKNWEEIALRIKTAANWRCQKCYGTLNHKRTVRSPKNLPLATAAKSGERRIEAKNPFH